MNSILDQVNIFMSRLNSLGGQSGKLHHARFAHPHELQPLISHTLDETALLLGTTRLGGIYRVTPTQKRRELGNMLVCAPPRSGKSILAISQLLTWPHSVVAVDIKGELYRNTAGYRSTRGPVYVIDPEGVGHQYDPLQGLSDEDALYTVAKNLLFDPKEGEGRSFTEWGILLEVLKWQACLALNRKTGGNVRLLPFSRAIGKLGINSAAAAIHAISPAIAQEMLDGAYDPEENYKENRYFANSWQSSRARMYPLLTEKVVRCFNGSDFTGQDIIAGEKPVSVYLRIPEGQLEAKAPLIRLILESLTTEMFATFDNPQGRVCRPVLVLIDEAGTVGFAKLPNYSSTCAGRGVSFWVALQDLSQLDGLYERHKARTIRNNMGAKVFFRPEDYATAKSISETLGFTSGYSHSETLREGELSSEGRSEQAVALLTTRELMEVDDRDTIFFYKNLKPGRGLRLEYWNFPLLEKRRAITPPPVKLLPEVPPISFPSATGLVSSWERGQRWPRFPIDPDDFN